MPHKPHRPELCNMQGLNCSHWHWHVFKKVRLFVQWCAHKDTINTWTFSELKGGWLVLRFQLSRSVRWFPVPYLCHSCFNYQWHQVVYSRLTIVDSRSSLFLYLIFSTVVSSNEAVSCISTHTDVHSKTKLFHVPHHHHSYLSQQSRETSGGVDYCTHTRFCL